ncbi:MAG: thioredoxin domain-containing protein [Gemmataceae bacterium]
MRSPPCPGPTIDKVANDFAGKVKVVKVNTEDAPEIAAKYRISAIPQIMALAAATSSSIVLSGREVRGRYRQDAHLPSAPEQYRIPPADLRVSAGGVVMPLAP